MTDWRSHTPPRQGDDDGGAAASGPPWKNLAALDAPNVTPTAPARIAELEAAMVAAAAAYLPEAKLAGWRVRVGFPAMTSTVTACCDPDQKVIWLSPQVADGPPGELRGALVHEVAHTVAGLGHGRRFKKALRRLIERACELEEEDVLAVLERDLQALGPREITTYETYGWVTAYVLERGDDELDFDEMIYWKCTERSHGPAELMARYPRLREVFRAEVDRLPVLRDAIRRVRNFRDWRKRQ